MKPEPIKIPMTAELAAAIKRREQERKTASKAGGTPKQAPAPIQIVLRAPTPREKSQAAAVTGDGANARILRSLAGSGYKPDAAPDAELGPLTSFEAQLKSLRAGR